jgi:hypothetical protein
MSFGIYCKTKLRCVVAEFCLTLQNSITEDKIYETIILSIDMSRRETSFLGAFAKLWHVSPFARMGQLGYHWTGLH